MPDRFNGRSVCIIHPRGRLNNATFTKRVNIADNLSTAPEEIGTRIILSNSLARYTHILHILLLNFARN